jgi:type IV secretion system protein VirB3
MYEKPTYSSYTALDRVPKFFGIPIMLGILLMLLIVATSLFVMIVPLKGNPLGLLAGLIFTPLIWFVRYVCETDDRAFLMLFYQFKWLFFKLRAGHSKFFGGTTTIVPSQFGNFKKTQSSYVVTQFKRIN